MSLKPTNAVADFITKVNFEDLPEIAIRYAVDAITDCVGVALAGSREPLAQYVLEVLNDGGNVKGPAYLFGSRMKAGWADAALYNGSVAHAINFDDTTHPAGSHPSTVIVPVLFSLGKRSKANGRALITAYVAGLEIEGKLGQSLSLNRGHYNRGWHATCTFGSMGAAAAGAKLLGLNVQKVKMALSIAASAASGLRANFGTMTKPLHAGYAARNGVLAALLAQKGFTGADDIFENRFGYLEVFSGIDRPKPEVFGQLGGPFEITTEYGLALQPFPCCGATHPAIEAATEIFKEIHCDEIQEVVVGTSEMVQNILVFSDPQTTYQAKFSLQFCVAAALVKGEVKRTTFSESVLHDPAIQRMIRKIKLQVDDRVRHNSEFGAVVRVVCTSGRIVERLVELAKGKPARWLSTDEIRLKFIDCCDEVLSKKRAEIAFESIQSIEKVRTIDDIIETLTLTRPITKTCKEVKNAIK